MLERKRKNKHYDIVPGDEPADDEEAAERDVELGNVSGQETGIVPVEANGQAEAGAVSKATDVTEELDNWDENEEDWDDGAAGDAAAGQAAEDADSDPKKRFE